MKSDVRSMAGLDRMLGSQVLIRVSLGSTLFESVGEVVRRTARLAFASLGVTALQNKLARLSHAIFVVLLLCWRHVILVIS